MHLPRGKYEKIHGFKLQVGWSNFSLHLPTFQSSNVTARRLQSTCQGTQHISIHIRYKCPVEDVRWIHNGGSQSQNIFFFLRWFRSKNNIPAQIFGWCWSKIFTKNFVQPPQLVVVGRFYSVDSFVDILRGIKCRMSLFSIVKNNLNAKRPHKF